MICKPRQARKGATVAVSYVPGCGWLGHHPFPRLNYSDVLLIFYPALCFAQRLFVFALVFISASGGYNRALFLQYPDFNYQEQQLA